jgi:hypothetical protein
MTKQEILEIYKERERAMALEFLKCSCLEGVVRG